MSSSNINLGNQILLWDYRQEARAKGFNQTFCDILPYGLYSGGRLTRISDTVVNVGLLVCVIKSDEDDKVALRIETQETQDISLAESIGSAYVDVNKPYIVLRFGWQDVEQNYMDIRAVGWSTDAAETDPDKLHSLDIILGKVLFEETYTGSGQYIIASGNSFDLTRKQDVFIKETESVSGQFRVSPSEVSPRKVFISGGKVNTSKGRLFITGMEFPPAGIPDTGAMGRTDLIVINANGEFQFIQGTLSALFPAPAPKYQNYKVLAEIRRGANRQDIHGTDIVQITDATIRGSIAAEDFPIVDPENFLPANARNIEDAFRHLFLDSRLQADEISELEDHIDSLVCAKYHQSINSVSTDRPIFFAKMKKNSTAVFNVKVDGPAMGGTICMAVSVGETDDIQHSSISILSTSIPAFFSNSVVYLATHVDAVASDYIFVGFTAAATGIFDISMQAVSSEPKGVISAAYSVPMSTIPYVTFPVSDGYLAGYPVIKPIAKLDAFHRWSAVYQYESEDPVFFNGSAYFANPAAIPNAGESPASHPGKWIQLARPDSGPIDLTEGAQTPQLFYRPGLIISNTTALKLRKAHQDQGMRYPSPAAKVYHLDGDLLDQNQQNPLTIAPRSLEFDFNDAANSEFPFNDIAASLFAWNMADTANNVTPHFICEDSPPEPPITNDPAIPKKPFKETAEAYYGSYSVPIVMPDNNGQNVLDYWFKTVEGGGFSLLFIKLPTGESFDLSLGYEEPFWNDNSGIGAPNNFPFNENTLLPGTVVYNERLTSASLNVVQGFNGVMEVIPVTIPDINLPQPNRWNHIALKTGIDSITIFLNGQEQTIPRMSSGFGGNTKIEINSQRTPVVLDEILMDWTASISFARYSEISITRLPWAEHEWKDGWMSIYADDPNKIDSNLALYLYPVGSVITQAAISGVYDDSQTPWARFHNFRQEQFVLQGEVAPVGGNGEKTRFWQRVS
jgi:hypothetical protein